jgi:UDP-N-acetyl-D-glucosamine dehydrogenase
LTWKAREYEVATRFIELAGEINTNMPNYVVQKLMTALNDKGKCLKGSKILILGVAYKPNVDDDRESPAFVIMGTDREWSAPSATTTHIFPG